MAVPVADRQGISMLDAVPIAITDAVGRQFAVHHKPSQDVGKVYRKCCFCVGKVYIDEDGRGRVVGFALGLIAMSIISHGWNRPLNDRVTMRVTM